MSPEPTNDAMAIDPVGWMHQPVADAGVHLLDESWEWRRVSYSELAARVAGAAERFQELGHAGQRVAIVADDPLSFVVSFFGVLATGGSCVPIPPRAAMQQSS